MDEFKISEGKMKQFLKVVSDTNEIINRTQAVKRELKNLDVESIDKLCNSASYFLNFLVNLLNLQNPNRDEIRKITHKVPQHVVDVLETLYFLRDQTSELLREKYDDDDIPIEISLSCVSNDFLFHSGFIFQLVSVETQLGINKKVEIKEEKLIEGGRYIMFISFH
jgi:hypothetical protein